MSASIAEADREICFDVDGTATHGTLRVPAHREGQRLAAALLLPGSGRPIATETSPLST